VERRIRPFALPLTTKIGETNNAFKVLISTVLSPQTKDTTTAPAFARLMKLGNTPKNLLKVNRKRIEKAIYPQDLKSKNREKGYSFYKLG